MKREQWIGAAAGLLAGGALIWGATRLTGGGENEDDGDGSSLADRARQSGRGEEQAPSKPSDDGGSYPCRVDGCDRSFHSPTTRDFHEKSHG